MTSKVTTIAYLKSLEQAEKKQEVKAVAVSTAAEEENSPEITRNEEERQSNRNVPSALIKKVHFSSSSSTSTSPSLSSSSSSSSSSSPSLSSSSSSSTCPSSSSSPSLSSSSSSSSSTCPSSSSSPSPSSSTCPTCTVQMMSFLEIEQMKLLLPYFQRIIDVCKIKEICENQMEHYDRKHCFHFNCISICYNTSEEAYYLIDGQHRYQAARNLFYDYKYKHIYIPVQITTVTCKEEMQEYYHVKNMNTPLPNFDYSEFDKTSLQNICTILQNKYPRVFSGHVKCHRPAIFFNYFQDAVRYIQRHLSESDEAIVRLIEEHNDRLKNYKFEDFKQNVTMKMYQQARDWGFYLGLFYVDPEEEYVCHWANYIVSAKQGLSLPDQKRSKSRKKRKIPKTLKQSVWQNNVGSDKNEHYCVVCHREVINALNFHAGHIISETNGGEITEDNILPICANCNLSMGKTNMDEFIQTHFPNNYENFLNRKYDRVVRSDRTIMINHMDTPAKQLFGVLGNWTGLLDNNS